MRYIESLLRKRRDIDQALEYLCPQFGSIIMSAEAPDRLILTQGENKVVIENMEHFAQVALTLSGPVPPRLKSN